jgi:hypothetical protein
MSVEGPKHRALGAVGGRRVVDVVDQEGEAKNIGEQDEFLLLLLLLLARQR